MRGGVGWGGWQQRFGGGWDDDYGGYGNSRRKSNYVYLRKMAFSTFLFLVNNN